MSPASHRNLTKGPLERSLSGSMARGYLDFQQNVHVFGSDLECVGQSASLTSVA